jgi:hypothetical protein
MGSGIIRWQEGTYFIAEILIETCSAFLNLCLVDKLFLSLFFWEIVNLCGHFSCGQDLLFYPGFRVKDSGRNGRQYLHPEGLAANTGHPGIPETPIGLKEQQRQLKSHRN